ncbi:MAG TPA: VWA domain-containing protein [Candidatus Acidoferrales bacterium]|jgi:VWFA-related protein|nr:VWA domain-containing protein [Candidatus Acidoferrales bacterium]
MPRTAITRRDTDSGIGHDNLNFSIMHTSGGFMHARGRDSGKTSLLSTFLTGLLAFAGFFLIATVLGNPAALAQNDSPLPPSTTPMPPPPPGYGGQQEKGSGSIKASVDLVVLHVTVTDESGQFIGDLKKSDFRVSENKVEQSISVFTREDVPVTMGLVIDNSGSMREKREQVNQAAMTFVQTSNPQDEAFVVNFNDEFYLDTDGDFTSDPKDLQNALSRIDTRGSTALYDAVIGSLDHLKKAHKDKRALLVITDGDDDASRKTLSDTMKAAAQSNAAIYAIGVFSADDRHNDKKMVRRSTKELKDLAEVTGGMAYFPETLDDVKPVCEQVARDIRNQYTIGYYPTNATKDGTFRPVTVQLVSTGGHGKLSVRTRTGYYAQKASASGD